VGVSLSRVLCCFIPRVAVEVLCATYLLTCWFASPKEIWIWCLAALEPSWFLRVTWCGEALCGLEVWGVRVLLLLGVFFSANCGSSISARFWIFRAHIVCFLPLVTILDPPASFFLSYSLQYSFSSLCACCFNRVALKLEMGNGMYEWGKQQCGGCCFCGPPVCLGIFLLLYKWVFVLGTTGVWSCVKLV
jgi:hypothetical protein